VGTQCLAECHQQTGTDDKRLGHSVVALAQKCVQLRLLWYSGGGNGTPQVLGLSRCWKGAGGETISRPQDSPPAVMGPLSSTKMETVKHV
jgi:hypothetical protein